MNAIEALILGIIQGLTEFLPVSSSGHLEIGKVLLGLEIKENMLTTVVLHFGTALSTIIIFRKEIAHIFKGLFQFKWNYETQYSLKIIISMIPAVLIGLIYEKEIEILFSKNMLLVGTMLIITALLLLLADRAKNTNKSVGFFECLIIGISQAIAILPGISRSGATISTSVLLKIDREKAARFSFLMVIPLIFGKILKDLTSGEITGFQSEIAIPLIIGFIAAFITGIAACKLMISLVKKSQLKYFAFYCFGVGTIALIWGAG